MPGKLSTSQLLTLIRNAASFEGAMDYYKNNSDPTFQDELYSLMKKKQCTAKNVIQSSGIERSYFYHILNGRKRPGRNMVLRIAFCLRSTLDETNNLLRIGGFTTLYPRIKRDAVLIYAISRKMSMEEANELLLSEQQAPLYTEDTNEKG